MQLKTFLLEVLLAGIVFFASGCSEKDTWEDDPGGESGMERTEEDDQYINAQAIIHNLCEIDSINGKVEYKFILGEALDETCPTEFSVGVDNLEEAIELFRYSILTNELEPIQLPGGILECDLQEQGMLTFTPGGVNGAIATLTVRLSGLPRMTKLIFILRTLWPDNLTTPFSRGNVVYDKIENRTYLCVAEYSCARPGMLFTLDGGWGRKRIENLTGFTSCSSETVLNALYEYYVDNTEDFWEAFLHAFEKCYCWLPQGDQPVTISKDNDSFKRHLKSVGFHMNTGIKSQLLGAWHKVWFYGYRMEKGRSYGTKYEWAYRNTFYRNGLTYKLLILNHSKTFGGGDVDESRYEVRY